MKAKTFALLFFACSGSGVGRKSRVATAEAASSETPRDLAMADLSEAAEALDFSAPFFFPAKSYLMTVPFPPSR